MKVAEKIFEHRIRQQIETADMQFGFRIRIGCNKFRQLVPLLTNKDVYEKKVVQ